MIISYFVNIPIVAKKRADKYLNNNENLPINVEIQYTAEDLEELRKCKEDVIYFAENYFYIVNLDEGRQKIKLYQPQKEAILKIANNRRTVICASRQVGKRLALDTPVPTPTGWITMGEIQEGDEVLDWYGNPTKVTKAHEIAYETEAYEIEFSNGEKIVADAEHDWFTQSSLEQYNKIEGSVKNTKEIFLDRESAYHRIPLKHQGKEGEYIYIEQIKAIQSVPMRCITVAHQDHIFLCGRTMIPTRNSTLMTVVCLWYALFTSDFNIAILANKEDQAKEILERIKLAYEEIPNFIKAGVWDFTKEQIKLTNGSKIFVSTTSADAIRGKSVNLLFIDEFAHVRKEIADDFFKSIIPTLSSSKKSKLVIVSCVTGDTYVYTDNGIKQIKEFSPQNEDGLYDIAPYKVLGKKPKENEGTLFFNNGKAEILKIVSQSTSLRCSKTHKLFACKGGKYGWWEAQELNSDDYISVRYGMNLWGNYHDLSGFVPTVKKRLTHNYSFKEITPDLAYLFGLYIAEGSAYRKFNKNGELIAGTITITCGDNITDILGKLGIKYSLSKDGLHYALSSKVLIELFQYVGFDLTRTAKRKIIPSNLLCMNKDNTSAMLQGMFDGDGSANKGTVTFISSNKVLVDQIRIILLNYGILTMYHSYLTPPTERCKVASLGHRLEMNTHFSKLFFEQIGFRFERKQKIYANVLNAPTYNTSNTVPFIKDLIRSDFKRVRKNDVPWTLRTAMYTEKPISQKALLEFKELIGDFSDPLINEISQPGIRWEKIKTIENDGIEEVYDFSLNNLDIDDPHDWHHSVLYNGIIGHQTPKGTENKYYEIFSNAEKKKSNWEFIKIYWHQIPGRDEAWKKEQLEAIAYDMNMWNQEFDLHFLEDGSSALNGAVLEKLKSMCKIPDFTYDGGDYQIWIEPKVDRIYSIGVDAAEGVGQDYSVAQVLDITDLTDIQHCATFATNKLQPYVFAEKLNQIARSWGRPFLCIESNKEGSQVIDALYQVHNYDNIITYTMKNDKRGAYQKMGIFCHGNSKYTGITNMKYFVEHLQAVSIYDITTVKEFETFVRKENGTWAARKGQHDDRIMSVIWALIILEKDIAEKYLNVLDYDETGKPSKISDPNQELANQSFYNQDNGLTNYARSGGAPAPMFYQKGRELFNYNDSNNYADSGWSFIQ